MNEQLVSALDAAQITGGLKFVVEAEKDSELLLVGVGMV